MKNCPSIYYDNCRNAVYKCNICRAGYGNARAKLFYAPIDSELCPSDPHPMENINLTSKNPHTKAIKKGLKEESKIVNQWISKTLKSGSILGDGDIKVGDLNLDVKVRTTTKSFTISNQEYTKGLKKGYDGWVIVNSDGHRMVCLTEDSFLKLSGKLLNELCDGGDLSNL